MRNPVINRRNFLKAAGATGLAAIPVMIGGYSLLRSAQGELPPLGVPYVDDADLELFNAAQTAPILVILPESQSNPQRGYLTEILRAEGLNAFHVRPATATAWASLDRYALVLVAEGGLGREQSDQLGAYLQRGGRLIAMRPGPELAALCGLAPVGGTTADGYLAVDSAAGALGFPEVAVQFHGEADRHRLAGAEALAWLTAADGARTPYPAVTRVQVGEGQAVAWAFDLSRSVVLMRQGNPAWANQERDGRDGIRANDAFVDWIDLDRIALPQADELMRLFSRLIGELLQAILPLPRLWYFPAGADSMLIATGDAHDAPAAAIEDVLTRVEAYGGHMSVYYAPSLNDDLRRALKLARNLAGDLPAVGEALRGSRPTPADIRRWSARGHEFGLHPYVEEGLEPGWDRYWQEFTGLGYGPVSPTVRTHRILWNGWSETARVQAMHGIRMNLDFYHYGTAFQKPGGEWVNGHFTGSGLSMRFVDEQGRLLNIYQVLTQLVDEHLMKMPWGGGWPDYTVDQALEVSRELLARCAAGGYSALCAQFHIDPFALGGEWQANFGRWMEGTLAEAAARGFPIWSAYAWMRFVEVRQAALLTDIVWESQAGLLTLTLDAPTAEDLSLELLLPQQNRGLALESVTLDGQPAPTRARKVSGQEWAAFAAPAGSRRITAQYR